MADNSDNVLNILVKLGVVGQQDVTTAKQLLEETAGAAAQLNSKIADSPDQAERDLAVLRARVEGNKELLKIQEELAIRAAQTPEEKEAVKTRFAHLNEAQDNFSEQAVTGIKKFEMAGIADDITTRKKTDDQIRDQLAGMGKDGDPAARAELTKEITKQTEAVKRLQEELNRLNTETGTESEVFDVHRQTQAQSGAAQLQGDDTVAEGVSALAAAESGKISQNQTRAIENLQSAFTTIDGNTNNLLEAIKFAHTHHLRVQGEIDVIKRQLQALANKSGQTSFNNG